MSESNGATKVRLKAREKSPDRAPMYKAVRDYMASTFLHFNAAAVKDAAEGWAKLVDKGGKMFLAMAGAMSTGEIGKTLADLIRAGFVSGISCTGANLEEDIFNLVAHKSYKRIPNWRTMTEEEEMELRDKGLARVTDVCIPENKAMDRIEALIKKLWQMAGKSGRRHLPSEYLFQMLRDDALEDIYEIPKTDSWVLAAMDKGVPIWSPGWEDSTLGQKFSALAIKKEVDYNCVICGPEHTESLIKWYKKESKTADLGFFQIGGGIAGDWSVCVVPIIEADMGEDCKCWRYFGQVSDAVTSYGGYSGALPREKYTWRKIDEKTELHMIESDAAIVFPMMAAWLMASL